jgi:hypothetical protein
MQVKLQPNLRQHGRKRVLGSSGPSGGCMVGATPTRSGASNLDAIIDEGAHGELMARGGHYAVLYNAYFRHQELDYRPPMDEAETVARAVVR